LQTYSNPFNPTTNIAFTIPSKGNVRINIYNVMGEIIKVITNSEYEAGNHTLQFNANELSSGIYVCKIEFGSNSKAIRMQLLK